VNNKELLIYKIIKTHRKSSRKLQTELNQAGGQGFKPSTAVGSLLILQRLRTPDDNNFENG